ncbi:MAG: hypothetical protein KDD62_05960, partial [Bdellovibrionales bacterium]|nr:hypothetical protein [Bdellovibrionales bacterium]
GYPVKVSGFLEAFVGGALPTQEQTIAGTLISEICAHGENSAVLPELAEIAIRTRSQITEALATDRSEKGIKDALSRWNQIYHTYRYPLASEAAIEVAVAWLIEQGKIQ